MPIRCNDPLTGGCLDTANLYATRALWGVCLAVAGFLLPGVAFAAGGEMPSLVHDIGISLLTAGLLALVFNRFHIPSIAAFLTAGILVGPLGLEQVTDPDNIDTIAQLGFIFLLFLIGLEIDFKKIFGSGKAVTVSGFFQYPLTIALGFGAVKLLVLLGIGGELLASSTPSFPPVPLSQKKKTFSFPLLSLLHYTLWLAL